MSQVPLTVPFQRIVSVPVTFRLTVLPAVLLTRLASTRGGREPRVRPANPAPPMLPGYWRSGNWPTASEPAELTLIGFPPLVLNAVLMMSGAAVVEPASSKLMAAPDAARFSVLMVTTVLAASKEATPSLPAAATLTVATIAAFVAVPGWYRRTPALM